MCQQNRTCSVLPAFEIQNLIFPFRAIEVRREDVMIQPDHGMTKKVTDGHMVIYSAYPVVMMQTLKALVKV